jgi:cellulose synthase/poly-beta-1,6-N-acetylglucosamine synthase-like glycosyltransferase
VAGEAARPATVDASVVIPVRDAREDLSRCLDSLAAQTSSAPIEVLVVDDGSSDGTAELAESKGARVLRRNRVGAAAARNVGAAAARGGILLFLDADCVADPEWTKALLRPVREDPSLAGAVGRYVSRQSSSVARFIQLEVDLRQERAGVRAEIDFLNSGCCALRREILLENPFDESYQRLEDVELSFRLDSRGHRLRFVPEAIVEHRHPTTLSALLRRKFNYARYAVRLYRRYPGKVAADSSTPHGRRWRLISLALAVAALPLAPLHPAFLGISLAGAAASLFFSADTLRRGFAVSPSFGTIVSLYVLLGNLAFLAGALRGTIGGRPPEAN